MIYNLIQTLLIDVKKLVKKELGFEIFENQVSDFLLCNKLEEVKWNTIRLFLSSLFIHYL